MTSYLQRGYVAIQSGRAGEAAEWFARAVENDPRDAQALACLGQSLCWQGRRKDGIVHLRRAGNLLLRQARKRGELEQCLLMVEQLQFWDDYQGALDLARQILQVNRSQPRAFYLLALSHSRLNQNKLALAAARQARKLAPDNTGLNILLASLETRDGLHEPAKRKLEQVLQESRNPEDIFRAHKELAQLFDKLGEYDQVFPHLHAATHVAGSIPAIGRLDAELVPKMINTNASAFDEELLSRWSGTTFPDDSPAPVFLVGFFRSGTTLTQEVLGAHPGVFVADEASFIVQVCEELGKLPGFSGSVPQRLRRIGLPEVLHLRRFYWEKVRGRYGELPSHQVLIDKTTMNTIDLGLINCIFPDAKVVFVMRDPRDVCVSCFMQVMTPTASTIQLLGWQRTAEFYAMVMEWWMHIKRRMTLPYTEFRYEDAISRFEATFKNIFEFLGLSWDPAVADFHQRAAGKYIASPSFTQVAQPLYSSSVGRWRHYRSEFSSISELLEPFITAFDYGPWE